MPGADITIRYDVQDILGTQSPFHNLTFKHFVTSYERTNKRLPSVGDLKRMYPSLLIDEIVYALGIAKWQLERK